MKKKVLILHGAGMCFRGKYSRERFGTITINEIEREIRTFAEKKGVEARIITSNHEGDLIDALYDAGENKHEYAGIIINPASFTRGYRALGQALAHVSEHLDAVEVHFSNPSAFGTVSEISPHVKGTIHGFGIRGYALALETFLFH